MNKAIELPWHQSKITLRIPAENLLRIVESSVHRTQRLTNTGLAGRLESIASAAADKHMGLIIEDDTRDVPFEQKLTTVFPHLNSVGKLTVFIATGTHNPHTSGNRSIAELVRKLAGRVGLPLEEVVIHDCRKSEFEEVGRTQIGNRISVNAKLLQADVLLIFSDMKFHYFAGYSNPVKGIVPGLCHYDTIERNHALALNERSSFGRHPLHEDNSRRDNPLAQDMWEGFQLAIGQRAVFAFITVSAQGNFLWSGAGALQQISAQAMTEVDRLFGVKLKPADKLVVSCGGYPNDESLYHAQKALELCKAAVKPGGEILLLAGCANGIGPGNSPQNFYEPLKNPVDEILKNLQQKYIMYSHKTYKFAQLINQMKAIHLYSRLTSGQVSAIHLQPCEHPQQLVNRWINESPDCTVNVIGEGNKLAVFPE